MVSGGNEHPGEKNNAGLEPGLSSTPPKLREYRICVPSLKERLLDQQTINPQIQKTHLFDFVKPNFRVSSPFAVFRRTVNRKEQISLSVPSPAGIRRRLHIDFIRSINWGSLLAYSRKWLKNPMNIALVLWLACVATFGAMLGLLLLGLLNAAFPTTSSRNHWIEIDNQVLNALFTLMSLYQHPNLFHHLVLLFRWGSEDIVELRKAYCKDGAYRPREWAHITVVVALLHCTCLAQYALCGLYWGYPSETRPELPENLFFVSGIVAPATAALYTVYSPLGAERESDSSDEESIGKFIQKNARLPRTLDPRSPVIRPAWTGGMFDCKDDATLGFLSFFCTCCVFGWNAERLGFRNMYVHTVTFLLLCVAPFWVFSVTALNIHNYMIGDVMGIAGIVLCICGLLYGGYWRIQMRKKFKLPGDKSCCGSAKATDYFRWLFCWSCSLAQEVRTGNFYDVEEGILVRKRIDYAVTIREECGTNSTTLLVSDDTNTMVLPPVQQLLEVEEKGVSDGDAAAAAVKEAETGDCDEKISDEDLMALVIKVEDGVRNCETIEQTSSTTLLEAEDRNCETTYSLDFNFLEKNVQI